jgi:hypothetical protein
MLYRQFIPELSKNSASRIAGCADNWVLVIELIKIPFENFTEIILAKRNEFYKVRKLFVKWQFSI